MIRNRIRSVSYTHLDVYKRQSGVNTPDLIWQNPKAITAVLADMYDSGLKLDEFDDWYGSKKANLANQTSLSDEATASYQKESAFDKSNSTYSYGDYVFNDDKMCIRDSIWNRNWKIMINRLISSQ